MKKELTPETELRHSQTTELGFAIKELGDGVSSRYVLDALRHSRNAQHYITEFISNVVPTPNLNAVEADHSSCLHTYMRKGMDSPLGNILWSLINEGRGKAIWYAFVRGIAVIDYNAKKTYQFGIASAEEERHNGHDTSDDLFMLNALRMWEDDFPDAWEWIGGGK